MKAIIFDFDGVIHDTFELSYNTNSQIFNKKFTKEEYKCFFDGNIYEMPEVTQQNSDLFFEIQNKAFENLKLESEVKDFISKLKEKYLLFIITSNQEKTLKIYFENNDFNSVFKEILGTETHKYKVNKFKMIFEKYNLTSNDCIFITDTLGDIIEGNKVGVRSIAVDFGFHDRARLERGNPFRIVSDFKECLSIINDLTNSDI